METRDSIVYLPQVYKYRDDYERLSNIASLSFGPYPISEKKKTWFSENEFYFDDLRMLDLSHQDIDDEYAENLFEYGDFNRLEVINLSFNPKITTKTIDAILSSDTLGSHRTKLSYNGRYESIQSIVEIIIGNNHINDECMIDYKYDKPGRFGFKICIGERKYSGLKLLDIHD